MCAYAGWCAENKSSQVAPLASTKPLREGVICCLGLYS